MTIILYGASGSGKTSAAKELSKELGLPHLEADEIRKAGKKGKSPKTDPFFFLTTAEAYQALGPRTPENIIKGMLEVRNAYRDLILKEIATYAKGCIVEAAFLDPASLKTLGPIALIAVPSEERHRLLFFANRTEHPLNHGQLENTRILQNYLIEEATRLNISVIENDAEPKLMAAKIKSVLKL